MNRWWIAAGWLLAALAAAGFGYFGHLLAKPHLDGKTAPAMQQVRLLEYLPLYAGVDDLAYLKALDESELFAETETDAVMKATWPSESVSSAELTKLDEMFRKLPAARQQQLRQLDEDFFALDAPQRDKLHVTLERYAVWLDRLSETNRKEILSAPAAEERLEAMRRIKKRIWRDSLPASVKARVAETADVEERDRIYAEYRQQESQRRNEWSSALRHWNNRDSSEKPFPFDNPELAKQVEDYVTVVLKPRLLPGELAWLDERHKETAQNRYITWYLYGAPIHTLAEKYPSLPEPKSGKLITKVDDLPEGFLRRLRTPMAAPKPQPVRREFKDMPQHGKWPDFAEVVAKEAQDRGIPLPVSFGPSRPGEFKPEVEEVLTALKPKLGANEKTGLDALQGKWPQYPKMFLDLARKYDFTVPGVTLPGSPQQWSKVYPLNKRRT
jgi:hypothetical protein